MPRRSFSLLGLCLLLAVVTSREGLAQDSGEVPARAQAPATSFAALDAALSTALAGDDMPADAGLWVGGAAGTLHESYFGRYDRDTVIPLSSASQWLAAATLLRLVDGGLLSLDDPLIEFFPQLGDDKISITVRQLLAHTSGLVTHHPCLADAALSLEQCAASILAEPRVSRPGSQLRYGSASYQVAGRIAEIVTGNTWQEVFASALAMPLAFEATGWGATRNPPIATGANGKASDYGRFLSMLLARGEGPSGRVLEEASVAEMFSPQTRRARIVVSPTGEETAFGLGAWLDEISAGSASRAGCPAILGFSPWLDREKGLAGVLMVIHRRKAVTPVVTQLQRLALEAFEALSAREAADSGAAQEQAQPESQ